MTTSREHLARVLRSAFRRFREDERRPFLVLIALLALVTGIWSFVEVADEVIEEETRTLDVRILRAMRAADDPGELRGPAWMEGAIRDLTALGGAPVLGLLTAITFGYLWLKRRRTSAVLALAAVLGGTLLYTLLKQGFVRVRPVEVPALVVEGSPSFPSGHSAMAAIVYLSLAVVLARRERRVRVQSYIVAVGLLVTFLVGVTRIALGVHYPSDVLAGWSVGLAWAALFWLLTLWIERRRPRSGRD